MENFLYVLNADRLNGEVLFCYVIQVILFKITKVSLTVYTRSATCPFCKKLFV